MFALCDGNVRFIADTIETDAGTSQLMVRGVNTTWEKILAKQDGQPPGDF